MRIFYSRMLFSLLTVATTGCTGGVRNWKEQVILPDGREVIVERSHTLASQFEREFSAFNAPPGTASYEVRVPLADGGYTAPWTANHKEMIPVAVSSDGRSAYVLARAFDCRAYARHCHPYAKSGQLSPPFLAFKYAAGQWQRVAFEEFPTEITEANLMIGTSGKRSVDEIENGLVTARSIRRLNEINPTRKIYRESGGKGTWSCQCDIPQ